MSEDVDIRELAAMIRAKRGQKGVRGAAQEIGGISASTLSRVEQGKMPDLGTFLRICRWLGVSPEHFLNADATSADSSSLSQPASKSDILTAQLRADRTLDPRTVDALTTMIRLAYDDASRRAHEQREPEDEARAKGQE